MGKKQRSETANAFNHRRSFCSLYRKYLRRPTSIPNKNNPGVCKIRPCSSAQVILAVSLLCFFPIYGLNNMLPEFIERSAILVPLQLILSSFSSLSFMVLLVTGLLLTFYRVKDRSFFMRFTSYGKMSLTNYLGQSIFGSLLFSRKEWRGTFHSPPFFLDCPYYTLFFSSCK